jgi:S-adenosylhomocysteine hydrolase
VSIRTGPKPKVVNRGPLKGQGTVTPAKTQKSEKAKEAAEVEAKVELQTQQPAAQFESKKPPAQPPTERPIDARGPVDSSAVNAIQLRADKATERTALEPRTSESRLFALVKGTDVEGDGRPAPSQKKLAQMVRDKIGPFSRHLSAEETARVLGQPQWADALRELGPKLVNPATAKGPNFLLSAHLARWMDGIFDGATLDDVVKSYKSAHPELGDKVAHLNADFLATLQRAYAFLPEWSTKPQKEAAATGADAWLSLPTEKDLYAERLENALGQMEEVPLKMKLTSNLAERLKDKKPFKGHNVVMVQHMLGQANPFLDGMTKAGLEVDKCEYVGVPYQKNPAVQLTMERAHGVKVTVPERGNIDSMWEHVCAAVDRAVERHEQNGEPILIVDDGGYASKYIHQKYADKADIFRVVEQTTRGLTEVSKLEDPQFPILNVAGSYGKRFESAQVGDVVVQAIRKVLDEVTKTPARKEVLVVGAGKVGMGVADAFKGDGSKVTLFDPYLPKWRKKELEAQGYKVITNKDEALNKKFLVVGCSGHRSINMEDFAKMSSPVFLASSSSKRVEIDTIGLKEQATKDGVLRRILAAKVNEQETWHYWLDDGRIVTSMADGLPVNFNDVNSIAPELIDHTMGLMLLGSAEAVESAGKKGLVEIDAREQFQLQAEIEGLTESPSSDKDIGVKVGETTYYGDAELWSSVARSSATPPEVLHEIYMMHVEKDPMNPLVLDALGSNHEINDETVKDICEIGNLAHIARLLNNEMLTDGQEDMVIDHVQKAHQDLAWHSHNGEYAYKAYAVEQDAHGKYLFSQAAIPVPIAGMASRPNGTSHTRALVMSQLSEILLQHKRCPDGFREHMKGKAYAQYMNVSASNVHMMRNPNWTTEELDSLFRDAASVAMSADMKTMKRHKANYAYDLLEAFATHPAASEAVQQNAEHFMTELRETMRQKDSLLRGRKGWVENALGRPAPPYR